MRAAVFLVALGAGCAGANTPAAKPKPAGPLEPVGLTIVSPARWDYHPPAPSSALAAQKLDGGGCVFTAEGGQRWTSATTGQVGGGLLCSGKAEASSAIASEDLGSVIRRADGSWIFVGASGALLEAKDPLGPFGRTVPAPEPLARVAGAGAGVLATTMDGRILRWEEATGWKPAVTSGPITSARVYDVAVGQGGRALALAFPEQLFASEDNGQTWTATGAPQIGGRSIARSASGDLGVVGMLETLVWRPGKTPAWKRGTEKLEARHAAIQVEVGRAPSASAVQGGRAVIDGDRYYEVVRPDAEGQAWQLARGRIEGRLELVAIPDSGSCGNVRLGARGKVVYVACVAEGRGESAADLRRSVDQGSTWSDPIKLSTPDTDQMTIAVSPDGSALLVGACRVADGGCKPGAPVRVKLGAADPGDAGAPASSANADAGAGGDKADGLRAATVSSPQLSGAALLPAFSIDGRSAYFLGRRGKDDRLHLFVSHDGGDSFTPRTLEATVARALMRPRGDDDEGEPPPMEGPETFEIDEASALRPGDDGTLGMQLLRSRGDQAYVLADDDGRVISVGSLPVGDEADEEGRGSGSIMSGHGRRVLAIPMGIDPALARVWESLDGGVTWDRQPAPQSLVREYNNGQMALACGLGGCLLGDNVSRVGWGGGSEAGVTEPPPDAPVATPTGVLTPIVCELSKTPWARIDNVHGGLSYGVPIPGIHEAMRGKAAWSVLTVDSRTGAIAATSAMLPDAGDGDARVVTKQLVGPKPGGQRVATAYSATQHEGFAVVRVVVPVEKERVKAGAAMRNVEIAWENYFEGTSGRARIADAGPFEQGDVGLGQPQRNRRGKGDGLADELRAKLISITSRGIFVHPHARARGAPSFFVDPSGKLQKYTPHTWPSSSPVGGTLSIRSDASAVAGELVDVGLVHDSDNGWATIALAHHAGSGAGATVDIHALSLLPPRPSGTPLGAYTSWAWTSKWPVGISAIVTDPLHNKAWGHFVGFGADGSFGLVAPVPTLFDLGDRPRGCSAAERSSTPRVNVPLTDNGGRTLFPGARHPVLVREPKAKSAVGVEDAFVLLTSGAVLHGTPSAPCVAAWEAPAVARVGAAAVLRGDLARAWMFRFSYELPKGVKPTDGADPAPTLEYRSMTCRYDPAAAVPESVWNESGVSKP